jgi:CubicO group peptidase (beta-lactamase class C family)
MKKNIVIIFISIISIQVGLSQTIDTIKLNNYFKSLDSNNKFMGSVALMKNGKIIYKNQIGYSDIERQKKQNENTKYRIGSISKTFTSVLVFKAVEEGKLVLNKTINNYFPDIKNSNSITISNLLNHRGGIHNFTDDREYLEYHTKPKDKIEMLSIIAKFDSDFEPNSKSEYSNSNYVLLSYILEKTYNKTFSEILKDEIVN